MEAATAADLTQASEIAVRYITLGIAAKGYVSDLTVTEVSRLGHPARLRESRSTSATTKSVLLRESAQVLQ